MKLWKVLGVDRLRRAREHEEADDGQRRDGGEKLDPESHDGAEIVTLGPVRQLHF